MESSPGGGGSATKSLMDNLLGLLRIKIKKGVNLAIRDVRTSDPYCVVKMGKKQKLKTRVIKKDINPEWNEDLTLSVSDPSLPVKLPTWPPNVSHALGVTECAMQAKRCIKFTKEMSSGETVYDHDTFSMDDKMGDAEFDIKSFVEALKMNLHGLPSGTVITRVLPCRTNCLAEESRVTWDDGKVVQDMILRLRNVECGEVELQLQWIDLPGSKIG